MSDLLDSVQVDHEPPRRKFPLARIAVTVACLLILAMWIYAFGFASKKAAYRVDDAAWRQRAQDLCEAYEAQRLELVDMSAGYIVDPTNEQMLQRADLVDRATDIVEAELAEVTRVLPASARDRSLVDDYRKYYQLIVADRRAYTERLRSFDLEPYGETLVDGGPVSNLLTDFAVVNEMPACAPPNELGGDG
jgi:hypothetical protein